MKEDTARKNIETFLKEKNISKREASLFMGQNEAYLHQFFSKGSPLNLPEYPRKKLAELLQVDEQLLTNIPLNCLRERGGKMPKNRIKEFRELRGLSQRELAERLGTSQQQIDRLEKKEKDVKTNWLFNISKALNVSMSDLTGENKDLGVASVKEIDVYGGCGSAAESLVENTTDKDGNTLSTDVVRQSWLVPYEYLNELRCTPEDTRIIEALGDSMTPTVFSGDKVIVDVSPKGKIPSPPGIFVIWDGMGVAIKRIEYIPNSDPPAIRVISDNPHHPPFERTCDECQIIGRVIGLIKRV